MLLCVDGAGGLFLSRLAPTPDRNRNWRRSLWILQPLFGHYSTPGSSHLPRLLRARRAAASFSVSLSPDVASTAAFVAAAARLAMELRCRAVLREAAELSAATACFLAGGGDGLVARLGLAGRFFALPQVCLVFRLGSAHCRQPLLAPAPKARRAPAAAAAAATAAAFFTTGCAAGFLPTDPAGTIFPTIFLPPVDSAPGLQPSAQVCLTLRLGSAHCRQAGRPSLFSAIGRGGTMQFPAAFAQVCLTLSPGSLHCRQAPVATGDLLRGETALGRALLLARLLPLPGLDGLPDFFF
eukprot:SAG22_NODE_5107_length_1084_cov_1.992893_1_plen_295_part_01